MAVGRRKPREPRNNQFGITLGEKDAELLRVKAAELKLAPTTLGRRLLEEALAQRESTPDEGREVLAVLEELRKELRALRKAHHNATVEILSRSGTSIKTGSRMSIEELTAWANERLRK